MIKKWSICLICRMDQISSIRYMQLFFLLFHLLSIESTIRGRTRLSSSLHSLSQVQLEKQSNQEERLLQQNVHFEQRQQYQSYQRRQQEEYQSNISNDDEVICRVLALDTAYLDTDNTSSSKWAKVDEKVACVPIIDGKETDELISTLRDAIERCSGENTTLMMQENSNVIHVGNFYISIKKAKVSPLMNTIHTKSGCSVDIIESPITDKERRRILQSPDVLDWKPSMTVSIVRVSTTDSTPESTAQQLRSTLLDSTKINFISQYAACSAGQLQLKPASMDVIDIVVSQPVRNFEGKYEELVSAAQDTIKSRYGILSMSDVADRVIFCLPPGTGNWAASAGVKHWRVQMNNAWCTSLTGTMHELGHTFGLLHAHRREVEYNDLAGYMGSGGTAVTTPQKCFNGHNMYQFNWFSSRTINIDLASGHPSALVRLASFVDYTHTSALQPVLITIDDTYFLLYNRAKSYNIGTEQRANSVTITIPLIGGGGTESSIGLMPLSNMSDKDKTDDSLRTTFQIKNYRRTGKTLIFEACSSDTITSFGGNPIDQMIISIGLDESLCLPVTRHPTMMPTSPPTRVPTLRPTLHPTAAPVTARPTAHPTNSPIFTPAPVTPAPVTPAPIFTPAPVTPAPITFAPISTPSPITLAPITASPITPAPITGSPITPAPITPAPITLSPITAAPVTLAPITATPITLVPFTLSPTTPAPIIASSLLKPATPIPTNQVSESTPSSSPNADKADKIPTFEFVKIEKDNILIRRSKSFYPSFTPIPTQTSAPQWKSPQNNDKTDGNKSKNNTNGNKSNNKTNDNKTNDNKTNDNKTNDNKTNDNKTNDNKTNDNKTNDNKKEKQKLDDIIDNVNNNSFFGIVMDQNEALPFSGPTTAPAMDRSRHEDDDITSPTHQDTRQKQNNIDIDQHKQDKSGNSDDNKKRQEVILDSLAEIQDAMTTGSQNESLVHPSI